MKISNRKIEYIFLGLSLFLSACQNPKSKAVNESGIIFNNEEKLTQQIIYDVFTPPVASRVYAYSSLASYEAIHFQDSTYPSISEKLHGFGLEPRPEKGKKYNFTLSATKAFFFMVRKLTFSLDSLNSYENAVYNQYKSNLDDSTYRRSIDFGDKIGAYIFSRSKTDNYLKSRGKPKYIGSENPGKWRPTPPDYLDGVEWCWGTMKTFVLDSSSQFSLPSPPPYSEDTSSEYFRQNKVVFEKSLHLSKDEIEIARFWDDNPFVMQHSGHMMFANKKITPGGHWIGITTIACKKAKFNPVRTAWAYALTSVALFDAFVNSWQIKYKTDYIRPVTVINDKIDPEWQTLLQTPPFPEYPSGHSTITRAASVVLTRIFGDHFDFQDTSNLRYIGIKRHFTSFIQASDETSISRFYGGIHYLNSVNQGAALGQKIGDLFVHRLIDKREENKVKVQ